MNTCAYCGREYEIPGRYNWPEGRDPLDFFGLTLSCWFTSDDVEDSDYCSVYCLILDLAFLAGVDLVPASASEPEWWVIGKPAWWDAHVAEHRLKKPEASFS